MTNPATRAVMKIYPDDTYVTPESICHPVCRTFPNVSFYWRMCSTLYKASCLAKEGKYDDNKWVISSVAIRNALEICGVRMTFEGLDVLERINPPCVFIGNHMSTLETFVLPSIISPCCPVTFVVKESLMRYPIFHHLMKSRDPIVVQRKEARADFATVMECGLERLAKGISIIIFPQSTRSIALDKRHFNSMGIKLARRANVPVVPMAIRTDAWGMGGFFGLLKDHGPINPKIPVHIRFGEPIFIKDNGKAEHESVYAFIEGALGEWGLPKALQAHSNP